jgi:hypothetical protein
MVCECGEMFSVCPFWQEVVATAYGSEHERVDSRPDALGEGFLRHSLGPTLRRSTPRVRVHAAFKELGQLLAPLYAAVEHVNGSSVIVDASKAPPWGMAASSSNSVDLRPIHLVRDPRGFAFSNGRRRAAPGPPGAMSIPHGPLRSYANWLLANVEADWLRRRANRSTLVLYDDLTRRPTETVHAILESLGVDADLSHVLSRDTLVVDHNGHAIGGNPRRPRRGATNIVPDDAWRTESSQELRVLASLVMPFWLRYQHVSSRAGGFPH